MIKLKFKSLRLKTYLVTLALLLSCKPGLTQQLSNSFQWTEGKRMGLSLTFDDARFSQTDKGIPLLDKYGLKDTGWGARLKTYDCGDYSK